MNENVHPCQAVSQQISSTDSRESCNVCLHRKLLNQLRDLRRNVNSHSTSSPRDNPYFKDLHCYEKIDSIANDFVKNTNTYKDNLDLFTGASRLEHLNNLASAIQCGFHQITGRRNCTTDIGFVQAMTIDSEAQGVITGSCDKFYGKLRLSSPLNCGPTGFYDVFTYSTSQFLYVIGTSSNYGYDAGRPNRYMQGTGDAQGRLTMVAGKAFSLRLKWNGTPAFVTRTPVRNIGILSFDGHNVNVSFSSELHCGDLTDTCPHIARPLVDTLRCAHVTAQSDNETLTPLDAFRLKTGHELFSIIDNFFESKLTGEQRQYINHHLRRLCIGWEILDKLSTTTRLERKLYCMRMYNDPVLKAISSRYTRSNPSFNYWIHRLVKSANMRELPLPPVVAQAPDNADDSPWWTRIIDKVTGSITEGVSTIAQFVKRATIVVRDIVRIFYDCTKGFLDSIFDKIIDLIVKALVAIFNPFNLGDKILSMHPNTFSLVTSVIVVGFLIVSGLLSATVANSIVNFMLPRKDPVDNLIANENVESQSTDAASVLLAGTVMAVGGLSHADHSKVSKYIHTFTNLIKVSGSALSVFYVIFRLFPHTVRKALALKFGSRQERDSEAFNEWHARATSYEKLRHIPAVLVCPRYETELQSIANDSVTILAGELTPVQRSLGLNVLFSIYRVLSNVTAYRESGATRSPPYSIHLCGDAGVGKTTISHRIINELTGMPSSDRRNVYCKSTTRFWDSYINQKCIIYDEFLTIDDPTESAAVINDYLCLISGNDFKPEFSSVDNPTVGMKGTSVRPELVMTISNASHPYVVYGSKEESQRAFDRRRNVVIRVVTVNDPRVRQFEKVPIKFLNGTNNVDLRHYTNDERRNLSWLRFIIVPSDRRDVVNSRICKEDIMTYSEMMDYVKEDRRIFDEQLKSMASASRMEASIARTPEDILAETDRIVKGFTVEEPSFFDILGSLTDGFVAQGKNRNRFKRDRLNNLSSDDSVSRSSSDTDEQELHSALEDAGSAEPSTSSHNFTFGDFSDIGIDMDDEAAINRFYFESTLMNDGRPADFEYAYNEMVRRAFHASCRNNGSPFHNQDCVDSTIRNPFKNIVSTIVSTFLLTGSVFFIAKILYRLVNNRRIDQPSVDEPIDPLIVVPEAQSEYKPRKNKRPSRPKPHRGFTNEAQSAKSSWTLSFQLGPNSGTLTRRITPIGNRDFLTYGHAFHTGVSNLPEGIEMTIHGPGGSYLERFSSANLVSSDSDVSVYRCQNSKMPMARNIFNRFVSEDQFEAFDRSQISCQLTNGRTLSTMARIYDNPSKPLTYDYSEKKGCGVALDQCIMYDANTEKGDCGMLIDCLSGPSAGKFIGMHVAGSTRSDVPLGFATIVTRQLLESFVSVLDSKITVEAQSDNVINFDTTDEFIDYMNDLPNCDHFDIASPEERFYIPKRSAIRSSVLDPHLPYILKKQPAILTPSDPRANGSDPVFNAVHDTLSTVHDTNVDLSIIDEIEDEVFAHFDKMARPLGYRDLTFDEAVVGIPGILNGVYLNSSAGYALAPNARTRGKHDWITYDAHGNCIIDPDLEVYVNAYERAVNDDNQPQHRWIGYLKDELVREQKIYDVNTRAIYCGDLISFIYIRKKFGSLLAACNKSYTSTCSAISINQASFQLDDVVQWINRGPRTKYIAGDYAGFDKRQNKVFGDLAYRVLARLARVSTDSPEWRALVERERNSPAVMGPFLFKTINNHMSGSQFTTIINDLVNYSYHVYCWKRYCKDRSIAYKPFDVDMGIKVLGDDHVIGVREHQSYNAHDIKHYMESELGRHYTSDRKDEVLAPYDRLSDITFLGCHFVVLDGKYCGAFKKSILEQTLLVTRDSDLTVRQKCLACCEYASLWSFEYYTEFCRNVDNALQAVGVDPLDFDYENPSVHRVMALTVARRSEIHAAIEAQGDNNPGRTVSGLTTFVATSADDQNVRLGTNFEHMASKFGGELPMDVRVGSDTAMFRVTREWNTSALAGDVLGSYTLPWGLLSEGNADNIQNMLFERYALWHGSVEVLFQVNGMAFQQGLVCAYFYPLNNAQADDLEWNNAVGMPHSVLLSPTSSTFVSLPIPYRFPRPRMNTFAHEQTGTPTSLAANLGQLVIKVISPLQSVDPTPVTISVYTRFPNAEFHLPRPVNVAPRVYSGHIKGKEVEKTNIVNGSIEAQGQSGSHITNTYDIHDVAGSVPVTNRAEGGPTRNAQSAQAAGAGEGKVDAKLDYSPDLDIPMPMHNTPAFSCSVPTHTAFPGMAKSYGIQPSQNLALHPDRLDTEHYKYFDHRETKFEWLLSRPSITHKFEWKVGDVPGTSLLSFPLNSFCTADPLIRATQTGTPALPVQLAFLNTVRFWRADFNVKVQVVKTKFHSGRIQATVGYAAPSIASSERNVYYNSIMDFTPDNDISEIYIPWQCEMDVLNTWSGNATDRIQDHALAEFALTVNNQLIAPSTVVPAVECLVTVTLHNVVLAEAKPFPGLLASTHWFGSSVYLGKLSTTSVSVTAQADNSGSDSVVVDDEPEDVSTDPSGDAVLNDVMPIAPPAIGNLSINSHFEHELKSIHEITRRATAINIYPLSANVRPVTTVQTIDDDVPGPYTGSTVVSLANFPLNLFSMFFAVWKGGINYRIFPGDDITGPVYEIPYPSSKIGDLTLGEDNSTTMYGIHVAPRSEVPVGGSTSVFASTRYETGSIKPAEHTFGLEGGRKWIDVSMRCNTIFSCVQNMLAVPSPTAPSITGEAPNRLLWIENTTEKKTIVYQYTCDDFAYGIFRIPPGLEYKPETVGSGVTVPGGSYDFGGYVATFV